MVAISQAQLLFYLQLFTEALQVSKKSFCLAASFFNPSLIIWVLLLTAAVQIGFVSTNFGFSIWLFFVLGCFASAGKPWHRQYRSAYEFAECVICSLLMLPMFALPLLACAFSRSESICSLLGVAARQFSRVSSSLGAVAPVVGSFLVSEAQPIIMVKVAISIKRTIFFISSLYCFFVDSSTHAAKVRTFFYCAKFLPKNIIQLSHC